MTHSEKRSEALLGALRDDLPSKHDEARIRRKLASAGLAIGATVAAANVAQAAVGGSKALGAGKALGGGKALSALASTAPAAAAVKNGSLLASAWVGLATSTKVVVVGAAIAGATYPAVSHWAASRGVDGAASREVAGESPAVARAAAPTATGAVNPAALAAAESKSAPVAVEAVNERPLGDIPSTATLGTATSGTATSGKLGVRAATSGASGVLAARANDAAPAQPAVTPETAAVDSRLLEEATLIERALVASRANDKTAAQRWLNEHARRFPSGVLARERERLRANSM